MRYEERVNGCILAGLFLLAGCGASSEDGPERGFDFGASESWRSEHFAYHVREGDAAACSQVLETLERQSELLSSFLGVEEASWSPIDYYKFRSFAELQASGVCQSAEADACYQRSKIYASDAMNMHELVHAVAAPLGRPPGFLLEGLAVALSCSPEPLFSSALALSYEQAFEFRDYHHAGAFVSRLIDAFGIQKLVQLYGAIPANASASDFASAFRAQYGIEVAEIWSQLLEPVELRACLGQRACNASEIELGVTTTLAWDCASRNLARRLPVSSDEPLWIDVKGGAPALRLCSPQAAITDLNAFRLLDETWFLVKTGDFALELNRTDLNVPTPAELFVQRLPGASFSQCLAGPEAVPVTDGRAPQLLLGPTEQPLVLRVSLPEPRKLSLYAEYPIGEGLHGEICTRCEGGVALDCVALSAGSIDFVERDVQGDFWLKLSFTPQRRRLAPLRLTFEAR